MYALLVCLQSKSSLQRCNSLDFVCVTSVSKDISYMCYQCVFKDLSQQVNIKDISYMFYQSVFKDLGQQVNIQDISCMLYLSVSSQNLLYRDATAWTLYLSYYPTHPRKLSLGGGGIQELACLSICPFVFPDQLPNLLSDFHQSLWNLRS